jgi:hypothetical protein
MEIVMKNNIFEIECNTIAQLFPHLSIDVVKEGWQLFKKSPTPKGTSDTTWLTQCMAAVSIGHALRK